MKKIFHLGTCTTCQQILKQTGTKGFELQDIKTDNITAEELDDLASKLGSYNALFSRRAIKYRELGLKDKNLSEQDIRALILEEYTFLKRPVYVVGELVFAGNDAKTISAIKHHLDG